ncbi:LysR substrate-binding domain-containing protein [Streptomyces sp. NPDC094034]|uniref:LysR family transcriptional regulator n=1 Tax=Streptomyces sp. NPDC094034 TaxID=3155309 RepID=UPI0033238CF6
MELRELRSFVAVAASGGFGRAAEQLHIAQPAVSQQVKRLERELGAPLFLRTTRSVELTPAGVRLLERAKVILAEVDRAAEDVRRVQAGGIGKVSVGFVGTATYDLLPTLSRCVRARLPGITLELRGERLSPALSASLLASELDLAVMRDPGPEGGLAVSRLRTERLVAVLPADHRLATARSVTIGDLRDDIFVLHPSDRRSTLHAAVIGACRAAGFAPIDTVEVAETATLVNFVAAGIGVSVVPHPVMALNLAGVRYTELVDPPRLDLVLSQRRGGMQPASQAVARIIASIV